MSDYHSALDKLRRKGYSAEVVIIGASELVLDVDESMAVAPLESASTTYNLRVIKDHRIGVAFSNSFNWQLVEKAMRMAEVSEPDKDLVLPTTKSTGKSNANLQFRLRDEVDSIKQDMIELIDVPKWDLAGGRIEAGNFRKKVISTEGVDVEENRSRFFAAMGINTHSTTGVPMPDVWESDSSTSVKLLSIQGIKDALAKKIDVLKTRVKNHKRYDEVVLTSGAATELLSVLVGSAFLGESLYRQSTPLRPGMDIGNSNISIVETPALKYSIDSRVFDIEGQRRMPITLMRNGIVESFLYDTYWANKASKKSKTTIRSTASGGGAANLVLKAYEEKDVTQDALVVDHLQGVGGSDLSSGRFSLNAGVAWRNMNGRTEGVRDVIVSGDLVSLLRGIQVMSNKKRVDEGMVVGDIRVTGLSVG